MSLRGLGGVGLGEVGFAIRRAPFHLIEPIAARRSFGLGLGWCAPEDLLVKYQADGCPVRGRRRSYRRMIATSAPGGGVNWKASALSPVLVLRLAKRKRLVLPVLSKSTVSTTWPLAASMVSSRRV